MKIWSEFHARRLKEHSIINETQPCVFEQGELINPLLNVLKDVYYLVLRRLK